MEQPQQPQVEYESTRFTQKEVLLLVQKLVHEKKVHIVPHYSIPLMNSLDMICF